MSDEPDLAAGDFSSWLAGMRGAIRGEQGSDVPCDGCTACCRSSQFVHVGPDETDTLARISKELQFPAPGRPRGHVVLGYDEHGHCALLVDDKCSIYEHRPNACRTYDCRVFAAAGTDAGPDKVEITRRAQRWRFDFSDPSARIERDAVQAAAAFLDLHRAQLRDARVPPNETQIAVLAIELHDLFLGRNPQTGEVEVVAPDPSRVVQLVHGDEEDDAIVSPPRA